MSRRNYTTVIPANPQNSRDGAASYEHHEIASGRSTWNSSSERK
jgi:hypothetical protein